MAKNSKLVVFNLPEDCRENEVEEIFSKFGKLTRAAIRSTRANTMAFIEFEDPRDADEAQRERHGYSFDGRRIRVEFSNPNQRGGSGRSPPRRDDRSRSRGGGKDARRNDSRRRR